MTLASPFRDLPLIRTGKFGIRAPGAGGSTASANHLGVDVRAAQGTPVRPVEPGRVVSIRRNWRSMTSPGSIEGSRIWSDPIAGNLVVVRSKRYDINYTHLLGVPNHIQVGDEVLLDDVIGHSGRTGVVQNHLHVGVFVRRVDTSGKQSWLPVDPTPLLPWDGDKFEELVITPQEPAAPAPAPITQEAQQMYRMRDMTPGGVNYGKVYLVTDRGTAHIASPAHNDLFTRLFDAQAKGGIVDFNDLQIATVAGYIAASGHTERAAMERAVREAIESTPLKAEVDVEGLVGEITFRNAV